MVFYHAFVISIDEEGDDAYRITAHFQGVSRSGTIPADLPLLDDREVEEAQTWLARAFIDRDFAKDFGSRLFRTLLAPPVGEMFREAGQRLSPGEGLRVVLDFPLPGGLAELPWELLYDDEGGHGFLARSTSAPFVRRYTDVPFPNKPPRKGPLRVLVVTAEPKNLPRLSTDREVAQIVHALEKGPSLGDRFRGLLAYVLNPRTLPDLLQQLRQGRRFEVAPPLHHATRVELQERIAEAQRAGEGFHVVHFIGHGRAGATGGELLLEDGRAEGEADPLPADEFAEILSEPETNLVVLNACETASASGLFQSVAVETLKRRVPAAIGMQVPILDEAAVVFSQAFYRAWAAGEPIESALAQARRLVRYQNPGAASDWSIPVLYTGLTSGLRLRPLTRASSLIRSARFVRWAFVTFLALLSTIGLLLGIPAMARTIRTEVPLVRCVFPYPMNENKFAVAFNTFTVVNKEGSPVWSDEGRNLADFLYERFQDNFEDLDLGLPYELRPPAHTCAILGRTRDERAGRAAALAERINADIVVYGVITQTEEDSDFALEFSVSRRGFEDGEEIAGPHALGGSLPMRPIEDLEHIEYPAHLVRTDVLSLIAMGLSYYSVDNYDRALEFFEDAEEHEYWPSTDGREIIYMLLGNASLRQASIRQSIEPVPLAFDYYERSLGIDPDYARAKVGLAVAQYLTALGDPDKLTEDTIDREMLWEAAETYRAARILAQEQGNDLVEPRVRYGLAQIYFVWGLIEDRSYLDRAQEELEWVRDEYLGGRPELSGRAGHAYAVLGRIAALRGDIDAAIESFEKATELASPFYQALYSSILGEEYCKSGQTLKAGGAYEKAIDLARLYGYPRRVEKYLDRLLELEANGCP